MAAQKRGLGRGLDSLLSGIVATNKSDATTEELSVSLLQPGQYQPRQTIADQPLAELAESIKTQGIIQPIVVRKLTSGQYEIIAGERRFQAAKLANLKQVPVIIRNVDDKSAIAIALVENIQRENLNSLEEAIALQRLMKEFNLTQQQVADTVGKSRPAVANLLRLLGLSSLAKEFLMKNKLEMGHARALLSLGETQQNHIANQIVQKQLTVRATENLVKKTQTPQLSKSVPKIIDPNINKLQNELEQTLGATVIFKHGDLGKGSLTIQYNSLDELDGILSHIK